VNVQKPIALFLLLAFSAGVRAHVSSNGFLALRVDNQRIGGAMELAIRDVELAVGLDANQDGKVSWGEVRAAELPLQAYLRQHLSIAAGGKICPMDVTAARINERVDGNYVWLGLDAACALTTRRLHLHYTVLEGIDPSHRGLLTLSAGAVVQTAVLGGGAPDRDLEVYQPSQWQAFAEYACAGVLHIWSGIDHLLFLLSLLLPAVLLRRAGRWEAVQGARPAAVNIVKVVTAFTLAHSITLSLAALDIVRLPGRLTESLIAASIVVAALNNLYPRVTEGRWRIAFTFGLLHGFGFASVLVDMGLPPHARLVSLLAFNVGVEAGQLAIVVIAMPLAYLVRARPFYQKGVMPWGSALIAVLGLVWLVQRALLPS